MIISFHSERNTPLKPSIPKYKYRGKIPSLEIKHAFDYISGDF